MKILEIFRQKNNLTYRQLHTHLSIYGLKKTPTTVYRWCVYMAGHPNFRSTILDDAKTIGRAIGVRGDRVVDDIQDNEIDWNAESPKFLSEHELARLSQPSLKNGPMPPLPEMNEIIGY